MSEFSYQRSRASRTPLLRLFSTLLIASMVISPIGAFAAPSSDHDNNSGFVTAQPSMLTAVMPGVQITPIITVGDVLDNGFRFEAIPDGISVRVHDQGEDGEDDDNGGDDDDGDDDDGDDDDGDDGAGRVDIYVNHETSKVPFPYTTAAPTAANGENDFDNSQVSLLRLNTDTAGVLDGSFAIPSSAGFQRFCSNYLATRKEGFDRDILFTNEEAIDYVLRQEDSWPPAIGDPAAEQVGLVVALDVESGEYFPIYGMGRHNHENSVAIPGYRKLVVLSGDDTFTSGALTIPPGGPLTAASVPAQSQLYSYIAKDTDALLADKGDLWAFVSDTPGFNDYYDFVPGSTQVVTGRFIKVPKNIATGLNPDGSEIKAADAGFPLPPSNGSWQRDNRTTVPTGLDGPQWVLEYWSALNNVFQFVRLEDMAYDKRSGMENIVYVVDSGRGTAGSPQAGRSTNGRVWKMEFDKKDPTKVKSLTVFVEGDDFPVQTLNEIHQPDNIETTKKGILVTEDPGSSQQFPVGSTLPNATTARLWYVPFSGPAQVVVKIDQSADGGATDVDGRAAANLGAWETTGIVDASDAFGEGAFLINVQASSIWVEKAPGEDNFAPAGPDFTYKRAGGQMLLIKIPEDTVNVQILALNDFHGNLVGPINFGPTPAGGVEYLATHISSLRATNPNTVVVSAGDMIGASPLLSALFHDEPTIEAFNAIGLDYNAVGNHEFDEGVYELIRMQEGGCHPVDGCLDGDDFAGADFRFLAANVTWKKNDKPIFPAYKTQSFNGVQVAFIGMTLEGTPSIVTPSGIAELNFLDEADTVNALIPKLKKKGIETIVVLLHEGGNQNVGSNPTTMNQCNGFTGPVVDIVNRLDPEVDMVISGHTHLAYNCNINGMLVTSASSFGRVLTKIDMTVDQSTGDVISMSANNLVVTRDVAPAPLLITLVAKYQALVSPLANRVVGAISADITRGVNLAGESALGDVIADAQFDATNDPGFGDAVVAFMNPGGIRQDLFYAQISGGELAGQVTYGEMFTVQPFGNSLVTMTLTGAQIDTLLEQQFVGCGQTANRILQVSAGFTYTWSAGGGACSKVDPSTIMINGVVVNPTGTYRVTVNSFLASGGDNFVVLNLGTDRLGGEVDTDAFEKWFIANGGVLSPGPQNRITVVP